VITPAFPMREEEGLGIGIWKHQISNNFQSPKFKSKSVSGDLDFKIGAYLEFGIWGLEFCSFRDEALREKIG